MLTPMPIQVSRENGHEAIIGLRAAERAVEQVGSYPGNMSIAVNGWVHGRTAYPANTRPWNSNVWFHLADGAAWVSFPGVRATPTSHDHTGVVNGGYPAPTPSRCTGAVE